MGQESSVWSGFPIRVARRSARLAAHVVALASLLASCLPGVSYRNQEVKRFIGRTEADLVAYYGQPKAVEYDAQGRKVLVFEWTTQTPIQHEGTSWTDASGVTHYNPPETKIMTTVEQRRFTLDANGKVIKASWRVY
ncbi:MAG: hypothetical protein KatS3mg007_0207 [Thermoanaerobaculum sp.]|nr:MAG: hypothetical protein KatS3mg007_0207 [Thermoanaerobaculum sp.]